MGDGHRDTCEDQEEEDLITFSKQVKALSAIISLYWRHLRAV